MRTVIGLEGNTCCPQRGKTQASVSPNHRISVLSHRCFFKTKCKVVLSSSPSIIPLPPISHHPHILWVFLPSLFSKPHTRAWLRSVILCVLVCVCAWVCAYVCVWSNWSMKSADISLPLAVRLYQIQHCLALGHLSALHASFTWLSLGCMADNGQETCTLIRCTSTDSHVIHRM